MRWRWKGGEEDRRLMAVGWTRGGVSDDWVAVQSHLVPDGMDLEFDDL